jgi:hypothetical protein
VVVAVNTAAVVKFSQADCSVSRPFSLGLKSGLSLLLQLLPQSSQALAASLDHRAAAFQVNTSFDAGRAAICEKKKSLMHSAC